MSPITKYCKICFKEIPIDDVASIFYDKLCLCHKCREDFEPKFIRFKVNGYRALSIYEYTPFIKKLIYLYKGCYDYELNQTFLNLFYKEIKIRFSNYAIVPIPSYIEDDEKRGFNHVVEVFKNLGLEVLPIIEKTAHHKQSDRTAKERKEINKYLVLKNTKSLEDKKILLVDDIYTTGSTMRAALNLVEALNPKTIKILVLAKTNDKDYKKVT